MILFFSGTGNSRYVAQAIGTITGDKVVSINELIKNGSESILRSEYPYVFVCPTYAWRIPRVVESFIKETHFTGSDRAYFILTCGDDIGNAAHFVKIICNDKGLVFCGLAAVVMPENYIAMFNVPNKTQAEAIIQEANTHIRDIANHIESGQVWLREKVTPLGWLKSCIVTPAFYFAFVSARGFYSTNSCINCGKCAELCPLNNIKLLDGKPQWGKNCTHCMACICGCPSEAIEYKNTSKGKPRYYNIKEPLL